MPRIAQSSHLQAYEYDPDNQVLTVMFTNGSTYQYGGVPLTEYHNLQRSGGGGTYFWAKIRDRYPTVKLTDPSKNRRPQ